MFISISDTLAVCRHDVTAIYLYRGYEDQLPSLTVYAGEKNSFTVKYDTLDQAIQRYDKLLKELNGEELSSSTRFKEFPT